MREGRIGKAIAMKTLLCALALLAVTTVSANAQPLAARSLEGMWSDPPTTITGDFCASWCTDAGINQLNALLDDPKNDARPLGQLRAEADNYSREKYIRPRMNDAALKTYPLDPADDPSFLRCEPYGFARQFIARHQLEIRQLDKEGLQLRYGEWDARRTVYMDGRKRPASEPLSRLGYSVGHWEGDTLVIETSGIRRGITPWQSEHSDQLHVVERYTRSNDGKTLTLTATLEDPGSLREPVVLKHIWAWAPVQTIAAYDQCEIPKEFKRGIR
jgi:hypothetical protein